MLQTVTPIAEHVTPPGPNFSGDLNSQITHNLIISYLYDEINNGLIHNNEFGVACVHSNTLKTYVEKMELAHYNTISGHSKIIQEMYILHQTCKGLFILNEYYLDLSHQEFRAKVLFPNIVYMLIRYLQKCHKFLQTTIKSVYNEINSYSRGIIQRYENAYYTDIDVIKTDILYSFLGNGLRKFDPLQVLNVPAFYKQTFRQIYHYYFKSEEQIHLSYASIWDVDTALSQIVGTPSRLSLYRDVLYALQIERFCASSPTLNQLSYNYTIFKNVIINNEIQDVYFSCKTDTLMLNNNHYKLMKVYNQDLLNDNIIDEIKKLPLIYKLFKCVHIINPKVKPYNDITIRPEVLKNAVLDELMYPFRNMFNETHLYSILNKIATNFTDNILTGEYINLLTLTTVKINQLSFISQVRKFIQLCIRESIPNANS